MTESDRRGVSEFEFIGWLRSVTASPDFVSLGPGDDCAALRLGGPSALLTIDQIVEGVHFERGKVPPDLIGRKAVLSAVSDIAAMAGTPRAVVVSVLLRPGLARSDLETLYLAMRDAAVSCGAALVGGDLAAGGDRLVLSVAVLGEPHPRGEVRRSGARAGDVLFVTGALGGSLLGRHLTFTPRLREARELADALSLHAMIDVSDGLAQDLGHILAESGVGAVLEAAAIPVSEEARRLAETSGRSPLDHALSDGEDFELLFAVSSAEADRVPGTLSTGVSVSRIGFVTREPGLFLDESGARRPLRAKGWVHESD